MGKDKVPARDIKRMEKAANAKGTKAARRQAAANQQARNAAGRASVKNNHEDNEEYVQIHKHGR